MDYAAALAYLDSFVNLERGSLTRDHRAVITLDRVREIAARQGNPQDTYPTLHIAGTKGKGSTCAFTASILSAAGLRVGLYISPHLQDVRERISINGELIPREDFARLMLAAQPVLEEMRHPTSGRRPTYFEIMTHMAFAWFAERRVDVAVIEVGLGGRLDATNIIRPVACAITNISRDHVAMLGDTLNLIAREKAGIFKPDIPVVCAPQHPEALAALEDCARKVGAPLELIGREIVAHEVESSATTEWPMPSARIKLPDGNEFRAELGLRGGHQVENWAVAVRLADRFHRSSCGTPIPQAAIAAGSRDVRWSGRLEELSVPGQEHVRVFADGAHNDHSIRRVLEEVRKGLPTRAPLVVVFGCAKDKDSAGMLRILAAQGGADRIVFTNSGNPRGNTPEELAHAWRLLTGNEAPAIAAARDALQYATALALPDGTVLAAGSLYLVGLLKI